MSMDETEVARLIAEERQRIARDLHDLVLQRLFATGIMLEGALRKAVVPDVQIALRQALTDLNETVSQIRSTVLSLGSTSDSVRHRILHEIEIARSHWNYELDFNLKGPIDTVMNNQLNEDIVAVTAELLNNVGRHSRANKVRYEINVEDGNLEIAVSDNGQGILGNTFGNGLRNLSDRAASHGGSLSVSSSCSGLHVLWKVAV